VLRFGTRPRSWLLVLSRGARRFPPASRSWQWLAAGELATRSGARSGARLLVITHLRSWMDADAILAEAARYASCPVVRALPGLTVA